MATYINPFTDYGFKKLFGEEDTKIFLIDFLNSVFEGYLPIIHELEFHKNEHLGANAIDRSVIFDLYCKTPEGDRFIIELQRNPQAYFRQRTLYYTTFAIQEQAQKGEWDFYLAPIYCIGILNFNFHPDAKQYLHFGRMLNVDTHEVLIPELNFGYIECPKFKLELNENSTRREKWLYTFTHLMALENIPKILEEKLFKDFFEIANVFTLTSEQRREYFLSEKNMRDIKNAENKKLADALAKGIAEGLEQGKAEGLAQGKAEGEKQAKFAIAKNLKDLGLALNDIQVATQLSTQELSDFFK